VVVCGEDVADRGVVYRAPAGKYDALNFGSAFLPRDVDIAVLNDVDTKIRHLEAAFEDFFRRHADLLFARVEVREGPQKFFYSLLNFIRGRKWCRRQNAQFR